VEDYYVEGRVKEDDRGEIKRTVAPGLRDWHVMTRTAAEGICFRQLRTGYLYNISLTIEFVRVAVVSSIIGFGNFDRGKQGLIILKSTV